MPVLKLPENITTKFQAHLDLQGGGFMNIYRCEKYGITVVHGRPNAKHALVYEITADKLPGQEFSSYKDLKAAYDGEGKSEHPGSKRGKESVPRGKQVGNPAHKADASRKKRVR